MAEQDEEKEMLKLNNVKTKKENRISSVVVHRWMHGKFKFPAQFEDTTI